MKVGFVGAGQMGMPMVQRIAAAGIEQVVFARRREVIEALRTSAIEVSESITEVADAADVLCVCTFSDVQLRQVLFGSDGGPGALAALRPGSVLVNHTTGSPATAEEIVTRAPEGVGVVDAPVSGAADDIQVGQLTVLAGGLDEHIEKARPVLSAYASTIIHVGRVGDAQRVKLVNNLLFTVHMQVARLAIDLGRSLGIEGTALATALEQCSARSLPISLFRESPPDDLLRLAQPFLAKDTAVVREVAGELGVDLGLLGEVAAWVDRPSQ